MDADHRAIMGQKPVSRAPRQRVMRDMPDSDSEAEIEAAFLWYRECNPEAAAACQAEAFDGIDALGNDAM